MELGFRHEAEGVSIEGAGTCIGFSSRIGEHEGGTRLLSDSGASVMMGEPREASRLRGE